MTAIVPTRDRPSLVRRAVAGVLAQRYPGEIECVVVFDQSEPRPLGLPVPAGRALRAIRNHRTPGLPGARNAGVLASRHPLLGFCDDDDEWLPDKLRVQVAALRAAPRAALVACGLYLHAGGRVTRRLPPAGQVTLPRLLSGRVMEVNPCTILARRAAFLEQAGLVDEAIPGGYCEDYEWLLRAARLGPIPTVQRALVRVHWHPGSFYQARWDTIVQALQYLLAAHPELARSAAGLARIEGQIAFAAAAGGQTPLARRWAGRALRHRWREPRGWLALALSAGLLRAGPVLRLAHAAGRGI